MTDSLIRSCLNYDGSNDREKGLYFDISNDTPFVDFNFQRDTSIEKLEEGLGRQPSEEEIENAKRIPFSVDYFFCSVCESLFEEIENAFSSQILNKLREGELGSITVLKFTDFKLLRLFFYLQVWRTSACDPSFRILEKSQEKLRTIIKNHKTITNDDITSFPLSICFLETLGGREEYTYNTVGYTSADAAKVLFINDFVVQFYDDPNDTQFSDLFGLISYEHLTQTINYMEKEFSIAIISNEIRKGFNNRLLEYTKVIPALDFYIDRFIKVWNRLFETDPTLEIVEEYLTELCGDDKFNILKYSMSYVLGVTEEFVKRRQRL